MIIVLNLLSPLEINKALQHLIINTAHYYIKPDDLLNHSVLFFIFVQKSKYNEKIYYQLPDRRKQ